MAYFFFTKDIIQAKTIGMWLHIHWNIVKDCLGALDIVEKSTGCDDKKHIIKMPSNDTFPTHANVSLVYMEFPYREKNI